MWSGVDHCADAVIPVPIRLTGSSILTRFKGTCVALLCVHKHPINNKTENNIHRFEKAYYRVPREEVWRCEKERNVPEKDIKVIQGTCRGSEAKVRNAAGESSNFGVKVGLR